MMIYFVTGIDHSIHANSVNNLIISRNFLDLFKSSKIFFGRVLLAHFIHIILTTYNFDNIYCKTFDSVCLFPFESTTD